MIRYRPSLIFFLALLFLFFFYPLFPDYPIHPFSPYLLFLSGRIAFAPLLWASLGTGLLIDLFSSTFWGLNAIAYSLATFLLFHKKQFFEERLSSFLFFSLLYAFLCELIRSLFFIQNIFSYLWLKHMFIVLPLSMFFYSLFFIFFPLLLWRKMERKAMIFLNRTR